MQEKMQDKKVYGDKKEKKKKENVKNGATLR